MLVSATCPHCGFEYQLESSFVGTVRVCPQCRAKFAFDHSSAETAGNNLDELRGRKVACGGCLRTFIPMSARKHEDRVECQFCDQLIDIGQGERLFEIVRSVEKLVRQGLLLGLRNEVLVPRLKAFAPELPQGMESLIRILHYNLQRLPFLRMEAILHGALETQFVRQRPVCDHCSSATPEVTLQITWQLKQAARAPIWQTLILGFLFGRIGAAGAVRIHTHDKVGLYFLCDGCAKPFSAWGRFFRIPRFDDYQAVKVKFCDLEETVSGTRLLFD